MAAASVSDPYGDDGLGGTTRARSIASLHVFCTHMARPLVGLCDVVQGRACHLLFFRPFSPITGHLTTA